MKILETMKKELESSVHGRGLLPESENLYEVVVLHVLTK